jgi:cobalt-zinc-cadmium resistance protein CzcA
MLKKIIEWSINNKLIVGVLTLGLIVWGAYSVTELSIDAVPDITNNQVQIVTSSPASGAEDIERFVTFPVEQTMATIPGIEEIRSFSRFGLSVVTVVFTEDTDIYWARQQVAERLAEAKNNIPAGFGEPSMAPLSTGLGEIYQYIIRPKKGYEQRFDATELRSIQDWIIRRQLLGVEGVADVSGFGGKLKQYEIALDLVRLKGFGLTVSDVFRAVEANNQNTGGAYIERHASTTYIRSDGLMKSKEDIEQTVISHTKEGIPILVRDVSEVHIGFAVRYGALTYNNTGEAVGGIVLMLKNANSSRVIENVKSRMEQIKTNLPEGVEIEVYLDRTDLVNRAISTVTTNLIEGAIIVIAVLVLLLGNLRAGIIVASVIPLAMLFAISLMNIFGVSGNLMSLGALDFGLIIDGAVIIVESTLHLIYIRGNQQLTQGQMDEEVRSSASKFSKSAVFGQIIILVVYLPLLALVGIEGKMFKPMAQTVMFAVIGALILSLTYVPMISALFLNKKIKVQETFSDKLVKAIRMRYKPALNAFIRKRGIVLSSLAGLLVFSMFLFSRLGAEFIPSLDEGDFAVETRLITGTSLTKTIEATNKASEILLKNFPEVKKVVGKIGTAEIPTDPMPMEACDLMVILKDKSEWVSAETKEELAEKMQNVLESHLPGISFGFLQPIQMRFNELMTGAKQDVVVKIYGEDLRQLSRYAEQVGALASKIDGVQDVYIEEMTGLPQMIVSFDRSSLSKYNISIEDVNRAINISFAGQSAGLIFEGEKRFDLVVKLDSTSRASIEDLKSVTVMSPLGVQVPLDQFAKVEFIKGPNQIQRDDAKRRIIVGFNVRGRDVESIVNELKQKINSKVQFAPGYYAQYGGTFKNLEHARERLMIAVPAALLLIFFLLYLTFQSLKQAALIFTAIPLAALGGILALWIRGMPFSISAGVGFIALFGVAVLNGIVLISEFNSLRREGHTNTLRIILIGTRVRLRPVLLTALVASLGFLPMALSHGSGAEVQKPLATVVIGGLITATILTLFVLPIFYLMFEKKRKSSFEGKSTLPLLLVLLFTSPSFFGQQKQALTLKDCWEVAKKNNKWLQADFQQIQLEIDIGRSKVELPKTNFSAMYGQFNSYYNRDNQFQVSQNMPFPTVFNREKELGVARSEVARWQADLSWYDVKKEIALSYSRLQYLTAKKHLLIEQDSVLAIAQAKMKVRKELSSATRLETLLMDAERNNILDLLQRTEKEVLADIEYMKSLLGVSDSIDLLLDSFAALKSSPVDTSKLAQHPFVMSEKMVSKTMEAEQKVMKATALPDMTLGYVNQSLTGSHSIDGVENRVFTNADRFQSIQFVIGVPLFYGSVKRKEKVYQQQIEQRILRETFLLNQLKQNYQSDFKRYEGALRSLELYENQMQPQMEAMLVESETLLQSGEISVYEYMWARRQVIDLELNRLNAIFEVNQLVNQLEWYNIDN